MSVGTLLTHSLPNLLHSDAIRCGSVVRKHLVSMYNYIHHIAYAKFQFAEKKIQCYVNIGHFLFKLTFRNKYSFIYFTKTEIPCVSVCVYVYIYMCACVCVSVHIYVCLCVCHCVCMCTYICVLVCVYIYIYIYIYVCVCQCVYIYIYIYIYILNQYFYKIFIQITFIKA